MILAWGNAGHAAGQVVLIADQRRKSGFRSKGTLAAQSREVEFNPPNDRPGNQAVLELY
jgi:hypothetical protein